MGKLTIKKYHKNRYCIGGRKRDIVNKEVGIIKQGKMGNYCFLGFLGEIGGFDREMREKGCWMSGAAARTGKERY